MTRIVPGRFGAFLGDDSGDFDRSLTNLVWSGLVGSVLGGLADDFQKCLQHRAAPQPDSTIEVRLGRPCRASRQAYKLGTGALIESPSSILTLPATGPVKPRQTAEAEQCLASSKQAYIQALERA